MKTIIKLGYKRKQSVALQGQKSGKKEGTKGERQITIAEIVLFTTVLTFGKGAKVSDMVNLSIERGCKSIRNAFIALSMAGKKLPSNLFLSVQTDNKIYSTAAVIEEAQFKSLQRVTLSKADRENTDVQAVANIFVHKFKGNIKAANYFVTAERQSKDVSIEKVEKLANLSNLIVSQVGEIQEN